MVCCAPGSGLPIRPFMSTRPSRRLCSKAAFYSCPQAIHGRHGQRRGGLLRLARNDEIRFRLRPIGTTGKSPKVCPLPRAKIFRLTRRANQCSFFARLTADEGRVAIVTNVAVGCGGREARVRRTLVTRTAKSCGPDAAVLASSCAGFTPCVATVAKEPFTGESTK